MKNKKLVAVLTLLCFLFTLMPSMALAADAEPTTYGIKVAGTEITSTNANNVFGDGKVNYDASTNTLTLTNANITTTSNHGIEYTGTDTLNIALVGTNSITVTKEKNGINADGKSIVITGTGTLDLSSILTINNSNFGIKAKDTTFENSVKVTFYYFEYGVNGNDGTHTIEGANTVVTMNNVSYGYGGSSSVDVKAGTLEIIGRGSAFRGENLTSYEGSKILVSKLNNWEFGEIDEYSTEKYGNLSNNGDINYLKVVLSSDNTTLTPKLTFPVTVLNGTIGNTDKSTGNFAQSTEVTIKANEAATGKEFAGWQVNSGDITLSAESETTFTMPTKVVEVEATYKDAAPQYTVTFEGNGGTVASDSSIDTLTNVDKLPNPLPTVEKLGYIFDGWYTDSNFETVAVAGATITTDTTLYAKWTVKEYDVWVGSTRVTGETLSGDNWKYTPANGDTPAKLELNGYTSETLREIYEHGTNAGWRYAGISSQENLNIVLTGTNKLCGVSGQNIDYGISALPCNITISGSGSLDIIGDNSQYRGIYASPINFTGGIITVNGFKNGLSGNDDITVSGDNTTVTVTATETAVMPGPTDSLKVAEGYVIKAGTSENNARFIDGITYSNAENYQYVKVAKGTATNCTVTFNMNGVTADEIAAVTVAQGGTITAPTNPTAEGYTFGGWYTDEDCTDVYEFGTAVTDNITLYAKWTAVSPTPSETKYALWVGGEEVTSNKLSGAGWAYVVSENTLTLNGYVGTSVKEGAVAANIYTENALNIVLANGTTNTLSGVTDGIKVGGALTISGSGTLNLNGIETVGDGSAIYTLSTLAISNGAVVNVNGGYAYGLNADGDTTINGDATSVKVKCTKQGSNDAVKVKGGTLELYGESKASNGSVTAENGVTLYANTTTSSLNAVDYVAENIATYKYIGTVKTTSTQEPDPTPTPDEDDKDDTTPSTSTSGGGFSGVYNYPVVAGAIEYADVFFSKNYAVAGTTVTITVAPEAGKQVDTVTVIDKDGDEITVTKVGENEYTFTMPASKVTVNVTTEAADADTAADEDKTEIVLQIGSKKVLVNNHAINNDVVPVLKDGRTLVPIRIIVETMGGDVDWDAATRTVTIKIDGKMLKLVIDEHIPGFGQGATIMDNRTYVPIRYVAQYIGADVEWNAETQQIVIQK